MSDFDKEAEREKLRKKFADDEEKRASTQRMSELLLKGATMTNRHCDDCGDPIFRQDGREFCPTCHTVDAADVEQETESTADAESAAEARTVPNTETDMDADATPNQDASPEMGAAADTQFGVGAEPIGDRKTTGHEGSVEDLTTPLRNESASVPKSKAGENGTDRAAQIDRSPATTAGSDDLAESDAIADARESLTRTLSRFARAAEQTDDPRRARDHLRAAREAAETLSALDR
jgi:uncharacterized Zn finger protein (UPF0148 family)